MRGCGEGDGGKRGTPALLLLAVMERATRSRQRRSQVGVGRNRLQRGERYFNGYLNMVDILLARNLSQQLEASDMRRAKRRSLRDTNQEEREEVSVGWAGRNGATKMGASPARTRHWRHSLRGSLLVAHRYVDHVNILCKDDRVLLCRIE